MSSAGASRALPPQAEIPGYVALPLSTLLRELEAIPDQVERVVAEIVLEQVTENIKVLFAMRLSQEPYCQL